MRLVGYIRESPAQAETDSAYAQSDRIRRTAVDGSHSLVAVCQDLAREQHPLPAEPDPHHEGASDRMPSV